MKSVEGLLIIPRGRCAYKKATLLKVEVFSVCLDTDALKNKNTSS